MQSRAFALKRERSAVVLGLWKLKETTWEFASESRLLLQQLETQRARALLEQKWSAHCPAQNGLG